MMLKPVWIYLENGVFLEKYNVVAPEKTPAEGLYPLQTGFGWTNAIFERFCQDCQTCGMSHFNNLARARPGPAPRPASSPRPNLTS